MIRVLKQQIILISHFRLACPHGAQIQPSSRVSQLKSQVTKQKLTSFRILLFQAFHNLHLHSPHTLCIRTGLIPFQERTMEKNKKKGTGRSVFSKVGMKKPQGLKNAHPLTAQKESPQLNFDKSFSA